VTAGPVGDGQGGLGAPGTGVVVTGAAGGIGRATCLALAAVGRPVAAWDLNGEGARQTATECAELHGVACHAVEVDVTDGPAIQRAAAGTMAALPSVGGLVHAAGVGLPAAVEDLDEQTWGSVVDVNLRAGALLVRALLPALRQAAPGSAVVAISSVEALVGHGALPAYCASKAGLLGLVRSLAHALGGEGIRVNAVCPGAVDTPMLAPLLVMPEVRRTLEERIPVGRIAEPDDVARVVRFLLSDEAAYVHGSSLVVDGGMTATT
jgi:NAD(P)-dependent dehydrogenase (short-subunit alcohol dehydrogenase family)